MSERSGQTGVWWLLAVLASTAHAQPAGVTADPLRPPASFTVDGASSATPGLPSVTMIVIRGERAYALIDGVVRRPGERFAGYRLDRIEPSAVTLVRDDASRLTVPLLPSVRAKQPLDTQP